MMLPILFLLLSLLDIKHPPIDDALIRDFTVNEIIDDTTTDCAEKDLPSRRIEIHLKKDAIEPLKPEDVQNTSPPDNRFIPQDTTETIRSMVVPVKPPQPDPSPQPEPPIVLTPEPAMLAILSITGAMLLFLLFGRRTGRRFSRRI